MNRVKKAACLLLCIATPLAAVARQRSADKQSPPNQQPDPTIGQTNPIEPSLQTILSVLDQLIEAQKSFPDNNLRIAIRAQVSDILWSYDEPRARRLFEEAFLAMVDGSVSERSMWASPVGPDSPYPVQNVLIPAIVRRDPAFAAKLAENIADTPPNGDRKSMAVGHDKYAERSLIRSQLASYLSFRDPRLAAQVARAFAERGDIVQLEGLLTQMRMKEPKAADELFVLTLERAKLREPSFNDIRCFASYLFPYFGEGAVLHTSGGANRDPVLSIKRLPQAIPQFMDLAYEVTQRVASVSNPDGASARFNEMIIKLLVPYFERFMPDKAASFRSLAEGARRHIPREVASDELMNVSGSVPDLLARADQLTDLQQKDALYNRASARALMNRNLEQAAAILEKITDDSSRANARFNLRIRLYQQTTEETGRAIESEDFEKAEALIAGTSDPELRIRFLAGLIERLFPKNRIRAMEMLNEAQRLAFSLGDGVQRARQLMKLAEVAGRIDSDRGFEEMKRAIAEFNRAGFLPEWERFRESQVNGEPGKEPLVTNIGLSPLLKDNDFEFLGSRDFDRALTLSGELQMKEAMALAQLAACRAAVTKLRTPLFPKASLASTTPLRPVRVLVCQ